MTKVEELRFNMLVMVKAYEAKTCGDNSGAEAEVDAFAAAIRQEERERIINGAERFAEGDFVEDSDYIGIRYGLHSDNAVANGDIFVVPASLLAPVKEEKP